MSFSLSSFLDKLSFSEQIKQDNLVLFPFMLPDDVSGVEYLLLDEALSTGMVEITEVDAGGSVNTILINNKGKIAVLILDGDELLGAKQNRMANSTVLVPSGKAIELSVSCVERGRWRYESTNFRHEESFAYSDLRRKKAEQVAVNLKRRHSFDADQGAIWEEVNLKQRKMNTRSSTDALHEIYVQYKYQLNEFVSKLTPHPHQVGMAVFINGRFSCIDIFDNPGTMKKVWVRLLKSYALDAIDKKSERHSEKNIDPKSVLAALKDVKVSFAQSQGLGKDMRLESDKLVGAALVVENTIIHLSVFPRNNHSVEPLGEEFDDARDPEVFSHYREARNVYHPVNIKCLLIAESPPMDIERYFYFSNVRNYDHLFLSVIGELYPGMKESYLAQGRPEELKQNMLRQFQRDGFFLIDLFEEPVDLKQISPDEAVRNLILRTSRLIDLNTPIVIITGRVYDIVAKPLQAAGLNVIPKKVPFPAQGHQAKFREQFNEALIEAGVHSI